MEFERFKYPSLQALKDDAARRGLSIPLADDITPLARKHEIAGKTVHNRIVYQPMEGCDGTADGSPDELTIRRYKRFAEGGPGIVWFEAVAIVREGRANPRQLWLTEANLDNYKRIVADIKADCLAANGFEPLVIMQATHSGRYSKPDGVPAPLIAYNSPIFEKDNPIPAARIVTDDYIKAMEEKMAESAVLAVKAGFDGVDIKACHRYLNCELLSAFTRNGLYGGSFENRTRFFRNSQAAVTAAVPKDFIVTSRMNAYDGFVYPYGFGVTENNGIEVDLTEAKTLIALLRDGGMKLINLTMGNPYFNPHVNRPYDAGGYVPPEHPLEGVARMLNGMGEIQKAVPEVQVVSTGYSYLREYAANAGAAMLADGNCAYVGIGRLNFAYPDFAKDAVAGRVDKKKICLACGKCTEIMRAGSTPGCVIRDSEVYMPLYKQYCASK